VAAGTTVKVSDTTMLIKDEMPVIKILFASVVFIGKATAHKKNPRRNIEDFLSGNFSINQLS
jgi:hypothetical protein